MAKLTYAEALKEASSNKSDDGYMLIKFSYNKILLPYKDGITFLASLANAEEYRSGYKEPSSILPLSDDVITASRFSHKDYLETKIAQLMGISVDQLRESINQPELETT